METISFFFSEAHVVKELSLSLSLSRSAKSAPRIQTHTRRVRITFTVRARKERERERKRERKTEQKKKSDRSPRGDAFNEREISEKKNQKTHRRRVCSALSSSPKLPSRHLSSSFPVVPELCPLGWCRSLSSLRAPRPLP